MRSTTLGALVAVGVLTAGLWGADSAPVPGPLPAPRADVQIGAGNELIALGAPAGENGQLLIVVDPKQQVVAVYHVDKPSGRVTLQSVRNIRWDLQLTEFNAERPLPNEIRALLDGQ